MDSDECFLVFTILIKIYKNISNCYYRILEFTFLLKKYANKKYIYFI